ncbi:hypothetical protein Q7A53_05580 [Halobacillus rhizosphaerae]|uniref:hypothetical protein n=1 Tax=Halobacillus rhizosphaerae TaxID=3064889 RepID=UPI00398A9AED
MFEDQYGELNGIKWSVKYLGDRDFQLTVGTLTEKYTCQYPMVFGMDIADVNNLNARLDAMQEEVENG